MICWLVENATGEGVCPFNHPSDHSGLRITFAGRIRGHDKSWQAT